MKNKVDLLLIVRGLLAVSVLVWHMEGYKETMPHFLNIPGRTAVWIFFGISGYVMGYGFFKKKYLFDKSSLISFYKARFFRIYPLFLGISLISASLIYYDTNIFPITWSNIWKELFMFQFNHEYHLSGVFWTLGIEVQYYLIAPLMAYIIEQILGNRAVLIGIAYLGLVAIVPLSTFFFKIDLDNRNLLGNLSHFFSGMVACKWVIDEKMKLPFKQGVSVVILLLFASNYLYHVKQVYYYLIGHVFIDIIILFLILLHQIVIEWNLNDRFKIIGFLIKTGTISYGIYAWHPLILKYIPKDFNSLLVVFLATWVISYVSFTFLEDKIIQWNKNYEK
ncbi:acyltransferase family protein [Aquirufa aurantiipilula]|uniref:Acyltransferase n=1 Tax=Aquirufa aurantiipilula TaxID=2696561 RepID=A0ABT6BLN6_9BACT|nr:acyltransferase [Aquirufa aurantiipilula]MDF5690824.1 acyltransferase [Aquirufa aurantiipilula]